MRSPRPLTLLLALSLLGCQEPPAPSAAGSAPLGSSPEGAGMRPTRPGERSGPGGGGMGLLGFGGMQGMGSGDGMADGMGLGMGQPGGPAGGPTKFPPWHLSPEAQAELEARRAALLPPNVPTGIADLEVAATTAPGRCAEFRRTHLYVLQGDSLVRSQTIAEAMASPEVREVPRGRSAPVRALPLLALVPRGSNATEIAVYPCVGAPFRTSIAELRAAPQRYSLIENRKGALKLLDASPGQGERPTVRLVKNIAAVVLL